MEPIKTYTYQCERYNVVKLWTPRNTVYLVTANDDDGQETGVSPNYAMEKEAMAWIISRLELKVWNLTNRLYIEMEDKS